MLKELKEFPIIQTSRLTLRELCEQDAHDFFEIFGNADVLQYYGMRPYKTPDDALGLLRRMINKFPSKRGIRWAITLIGEPKFIGTIGYKNWDTRSNKGEISYELIPHYWANGYMTEAVKAVRDFGFRHGLNRIEAWEMQGNDASRRVLEKSGFSYEGTWRERMFWNGAYQHIEWFSILQREWDENS